VINVVIGRSLLRSVLFALAIAVGLTPRYPRASSQRWWQ